MSIESIHSYLQAFYFFDAAEDTPIFVDGVAAPWAIDDPTFVINWTRNAEVEALQSEAEQICQGT